MKMKAVFGKKRIAAAVVLTVAAFVAFPLMVSHSSADQASFDEWALPVGTPNNVAWLPGGRYLLVAPFASTAPSKSGEDPVDGPDALDNHYIRLIDTQHPDADPLSADLGKCFYPNKLYFDSNNSIAFVRATKYDPAIDQGPSEVICYVNVYVKTTGDAPRFGPLLTIPLPAASSQGSQDAIPAGSPDFAVGRDGKLLVYTDGRSVFIYDFLKGNNYPVPLIADNDYKPLALFPADYHAITTLDIDHASNLITVVVNARHTENGVPHYSSQIYFYQLNEEPGGTFGTIDLVGLIAPEMFPAGTAMAPGSNVAISPDHKSGYFMADDGTLFVYEIPKSILDGQVKVVRNYPQLVADPDPTNRGPRFLHFNPGTADLGIVKKGFVLLVKRPAYGSRPGKVKRPAYLTFEERPALLLAQVSGNKVSSSIELTSQLGESFGISNLEWNQNSRGFFATYGGSLMSVGPSGDLQYVREIELRTDTLSYEPVDSEIAGVSSFNVNLNKGKITSTGHVVVVKFQSGKSDLATAGITSMLAPASALIKEAGSIRRPCYLGR